MLYKYRLYMETLPPQFEPSQIEKKCYSLWEEKGIFEARIDKDKKPYCIVIPPPNITGALHLGHALDETLQDILIRFKRMQGFQALWIPGCDHAGIAAQNVVERELAKEGLRKEDLGREKFIQKMWEWKEEYERLIIQQLKELGASCDWSRFAFTMDEKRARAVRKAFVELFREGLIYRDNYMVNWCPRCETALSDVEVEHEEISSHLYHINYPLRGGGEITVVTTRPETMLGDTAVAVHPEDKRYHRLEGKEAILPLVGRVLPIIQDERVDPNFGTGVVKITPAHDPVDFEIGKKHGLPFLVIMDKKGIMNENAGKYQGLERFKAREVILRDLRKEGYLLKVEDYTHAVGHCYRCGTIIEPYISPQWFIRIKELVKPAIKMVKKDRIKFVPSRWKKVYLDWMEKVQDWCISRQIWWGHRIPVWYCKDCGHMNVDEKTPSTCEKCKSKNLEQETDVLDTWFSSGLWPLSTLGWPESTPDFKYFYPTSTLVTGYEIIFFWVARMIMLGLKFGKDIPFQYVYVHPIVRDSQGRKMSKSLGNVVEPSKLIKRFGCDALRMALAQLNTGAGQDIFFSLDRFEGMRNFANKIWNASRFVLMHLSEDFSFSENLTDLPLNRDDRYILSRLDGVIETSTNLLENFQFSDCGMLLYNFFWHEYCDWYVELSKIRLKGKEGDKKVAQMVNFKVLETSLRLLHPFMPFITEEIWQKLRGFLPHSPPSIAIASWPEPMGLRDPTVEEEERWKFEVISGCRSLRSEWRIPPNHRPTFYIKPLKERESEVLEEERESILHLTRAGKVIIGPKGEISTPCTRYITDTGTIIFLSLESVDLRVEEERLMKELLNLEARRERVERKLKNHDFLSKAPAEVVERYQKEMEELDEKRERILENLKIIKG